MIRTSLAATLALVFTNASAQYEVPLIELTAGMYRIEAEVMTTPERRAMIVLRLRLHVLDVNNFSSAIQECY